MFQFQTSYKA